MYGTVPITTPSRVCASVGSAEFPESPPALIFARPKSSTFTEPLAAHHDVRGLEVAVDDALVVGGRQRFGQCRADRHEAVDRHPALGDELVERLALDELHRQEVDAVGLLDGVDGDDARVIERGEGLGLALEALEPLRASRPSRPAAP